MAFHPRDAKTIGTDRLSLLGDHNERVGAVMTISNLFFSPETKQRDLHEVGSQYETPEFDPDIVPATAD